MQRVFWPFFTRNNDTDALISGARLYLALLITGLHLPSLIIPEFGAVKLIVPRHPVDLNVHLFAGRPHHRWVLFGAV